MATPAIRPLAPGLALVCLLGTGVTAQAPEESADLQQFGAAVEVRVVNVDVHVTDKQGNPVTGLGPEDFELFEDRRPVAISNFYAVEDGRPDAGAAAEAEARPAAEAPPTAPTVAEELPPEQQLHMVVYVDNLNLRPFNRNRVLRSLRTFLDQHLAPGDRAMVVSYERSLHVRQPFTSDSGALSRALLELETLSAQGVHADSDRRDVLRDIQERDDLSFAESRVRAYAESQYNDLQFTIDALKDFVRHLGGLPGRKALVYVSDGVPMRPGEDLYYALNQSSQQQVSLLEVQRFDASRRFDELASMAASDRVAFYALEATGLRVPSSASALEREPGAGPLIDSVYISNMQAPLQLLAEKTGGQAVLNTNNMDPALDRIARELRTYYSLGYQPARPQDGRYHRIEVKVKDKGLRVRHRQGYRDETVESQMEQAVMAGLMFGRNDNPLAVRLEIGRPERREDGNYQVPLQVLLPLSNLTLVPQAGERTGRVRLFLAVMDTRGDSTPVHQVPIPIHIKEERWEAVQAAAYPYEIPLTMAPGEQRLAIGIRDEIGAAESFIVQTVTPGS
ncbi:MAG: VWA domain-containing protein [Thermoanaerobaculia bacterium]